MTLSSEMLQKNIMKTQATFKMYDFINQDAGCTKNQLIIIGIIKLLVY